MSWTLQDTWQPPASWPRARSTRERSCKRPECEAIAFDDGVRPVKRVLLLQAKGLAAVTEKENASNTNVPFSPAIKHQGKPPSGQYVERVCRHDEQGEKQ